MGLHSSVTSVGMRREAYQRCAELREFPIEKEIGRARGDGKDERQRRGERRKGGKEKKRKSVGRVGENGRERSREFYLSASLINKRAQVADFIYQEFDTAFVSRFYCL